MLQNIDKKHVKIKKLIPWPTFTPSDRPGVFWTSYHAVVLPLVASFFWLRGVSSVIISALGLINFALSLIKAMLSCCEKQLSPSSGPDLALLLISNSSCQLGLGKITTLYGTPIIQPKLFLDFLFCHQQIYRVPSILCDTQFLPFTDAS